MAQYTAIESFQIYDPAQYVQVTILQNQEAPYDIKALFNPDSNNYWYLNYPENTDRGPKSGGIIATMCGGTTKITTYQQDSWPYAYALIEKQSAYCGYNGGGGGCTLFIQSVQIIPVSGPSTSDAVAQIVPGGNEVNEDLFFSIDNVNWKTNDNYFANLAPGNYTAYVKNSTPCSASFPFTVPGFVENPLSINSVSVTHETAPMANDGTATINASGSATPLTYSLDGIVFQSNKKFTGLAPGVYTAYVKDSTSAVVQLQFTVDSFTSFINFEPKVTIGNNTSYWLAAHNVISFRFQRQDYKIIDISESGASTMLLLDKPLETVFEIGELVMVKTANYKGAYSVKEATGNTVIIDAPYVYAQNETGILNGNNKTNYRVELKIETIDGQTSLGYFSPDTLGLTDCKIQGKIRNLVNNRNDFQYDVRNWNDNNAFKEFILYYRETWDIAPGDPTSFDWHQFSNSYFTVNAAKQIGDLYSSNMAEYVTYPDGSPKARFLSTFKRPTFFIGYPFDLSFIFSELIQDGILEVNEINMDVNGNQVVNDTALLAQDFSFLLTQENQLILMEDDANTKKLLRKNVGVHRLMLNNFYINRTSRKEVKLLHTLAGVITQVSETKVINVDNGCRKYPVYIAWLNTLGGWDYWLYDVTQKVTLDVNGVKTYERFVYDVSTAEGTIETISKDAIDKVIVGDTVDVETFKSLRNVMFSPKVLLLIGQDPVKWITVQVEAGSLSYETADGTADIEFAILLPKMNIQSN